MNTETGLAGMGRRVAFAREKAGLKQEELSRKLGFKDRQTLAALEAGERRVTAEELLKLLQVLGLPFEFFTDPFRLVGEGSFSFRANGPGEAGLEEFEDMAGRWIAFWREQGKKQGQVGGALRLQLDLTAQATYEDAQTAAADVAAQLSLGDIPAESLPKAIEDRLGVLVLYVDMPPGVSGAACQLPGSNTILINRQEPEGRRNFDLAHELFHVLSWHALPPKRVDRGDKNTGYKDKHIERLADCFASALLMPADKVRQVWNNSQERGVATVDAIRFIAERYRVSGVAVKWRLVALGLLSKPDLVDFDDQQLVLEGGNPPALFSRTFVERAGRAIERGDVSVMRLWKLLGLTGMGGLENLFRDHGLPVPFDM